MHLWLWNLSPSMQVGLRLMPQDAILFARSNEGPEGVLEDEAKAAKEKDAR